MNITQINTLLFAYTRRTLVISTAHIPSTTAAALDYQIFHLCSPVRCDGGWVFNVPDAEFEGMPVHEKHTELVTLLKFANTQGFDHLRLDRDADQLPPEFNFPVFAW